jgi:hypothetical protein
MLHCGVTSSHLPWAMLGLRAAPKDDSGVPAVELTFGAILKLPGELVGAPAAATEVLAAELRSDCSSFMPLPLRACWYAEVAGKQLGELLAAKLVYIGRGGVQPAMADKYDGPVAAACCGGPRRESDSGQTEAASGNRPCAAAGTAETWPPAFEAAAVISGISGGSVTAREICKNVRENPGDYCI